MKVIRGKPHARRMKHVKRRHEEGSIMAVVAAAAMDRDNQASLRVWRHQHFIGSSIVIAATIIGEFWACKVRMNENRG